MKNPAKKKEKWKLEFYAEVGTRELLIVDREPWSLELFQLKRGRLQSAGNLVLPRAAVLTSCVLPLTFQLQKSRPRPIIQMVHTGTGQTWTA